MIPSNSLGYRDQPESSSRIRLEPSTSAPPVHPGHHRDKLDLIRDSLRPFEQNDYSNTVNNNTYNVIDDTTYPVFLEKLDSNQRIMMNALTQGGYDQEAAYYALKLVNFRSVTDAAKVLTDLKQKISLTGVAPSTFFPQTKSTSPYLLTNTRSLPANDTSFCVNGFEPFGYERNQNHIIRPETSYRTETDYPNIYADDETVIRIRDSASVPVIRSRLSRPNVYVPPNYEHRISAPASYKNQTDVQMMTASTSKLKVTENDRKRSVSPLPPSVAQKLRNNTYEKMVKGCKAAMFRFFMEQHTEKLIQQWKERNQRALQLAKDMEAVNFSENMRDKMVKFLRQKESRYIRLRRQKMNKGMFELIRHIGVGAFGKVTLVKNRETGEVYAMKTLSKEDVIQKQQAAHVKAERDILAEANSDWIVKLFFSFQDSHNLYFIMEYVPGGDLMQLLIMKGVFTESLARTYTAELTCALEYVHGLGFIHRDIKPDNILIDKEGHIKLTDFGLCTGLRWTHDKRHYVSYDEPSSMGHFRDDSTNSLHNPSLGRQKPKLLEYRQRKKRNQANSMVGTGNYMAPEVIERTGHTQLCDWWSVGVILYEMVYGRPPFLSESDNPMDTQHMIVNWKRYLDLRNPRLSRECVDLIAWLCCDQSDRLGKNGAAEVKAHPWFKGVLINGVVMNPVDFHRLRETRPEFVPRVEHAEDTSNFDTFEVNSDEIFRENGTEGTAYNPAFFDFTFRHFFASDGMNKLLHPTSRSQQRPSLANIIHSPNKNAEPGQSERMVSQPLHPIFNKPLRNGPSSQQTALYSTYMSSSSSNMTRAVPQYDTLQEADEDDATGH
ncbi:unnamed protein product [Bursaphelenchus okinawaensis]|uniref:non-specific serine/threonine protein kinase n=1 Tax=Bursaphelenchus okinawaensis TaxID=465554 RepID=A0A811JTA9_9BILA|nr:unnamed protein product [Bursaphelenchus okinawaensis]CAG9081938.1 unnamed protein product [Bursaphelenchus okinawaensis]